MQCILQRCSVPLKEVSWSSWSLWLEVASIFIKTQLPSRWEEHHLWFTQKNWISCLFWKLHNVLNICTHTILSMTPFLLQYVTLIEKNPVLLYWDKNTIDLKEPQKHDFTSPKSSQLKSRIAHPQVILRVFSIRTFLKMTWQECLGSKMNQIWFQLIWLILIDFQYGTKHQKKW